MLNTPSPTHRELTSEANGEDFSKVLKGWVIPPRPIIMEELLPEMRSANPNINIIAKLVRKDVGLTTGILRVVNAPFFGLTRKISSVESAINLLGFTNLSKLVTGILVKQAMTRGDLTQFWETAEGVANITGHLANHYAPYLREDAFTFGLLQNIGVALIMQKYVDYDEIEYQAQTNDQTIIEVEQEFYETNHTTLGYILARSWNLSKDLSQAILRHHDITAFDQEDSIPETTRDLIALGTFAARMQDDLAGREQRKDWTWIATPVRQQLRITEIEYQELKASWQAISEFKT